MKYFIVLIDSVKSRTTNREIKVILVGCKVLCKVEEERKEEVLL